MGLDCYVNARAPEPSTAEPENLWYGRKTNAIHGWMEQQWLDQEVGRDCMDFNCEDLILTEELLNQLEDACVNEQLRETKGFFFGGAESPDEIAEDVQTILPTARAALAEGKEVFYTSWW